MPLTLASRSPQRRAILEQLGVRFDVVVPEVEETTEGDPRGMVVEIEGSARLLGAPVKLSRTPGDANRRPGPGLGEHTDAVLRDAGYDDDAIAKLKDAGAVAGPAESPQGSFLA